MREALSYSYQSLVDGKPEATRVDIDAVLRGEEPPSVVREREEAAVRERIERAENQRRAWAVARGGQVG